MANPHLSSYLLVKTNFFSVRMAITQGCLLLPLLFNIVLEVLVTAIRKINKSIHTGKKEDQIQLYEKKMILGYPFLHHAQK